MFLSRDGVCLFLSNNTALQNFVTNVVDNTHAGDYIVNQSGMWWSEVVYSHSVNKPPRFDLPNEVR